MGCVDLRATLLKKRAFSRLAVTPDQIGFFGAAQVVRIHRRFQYLKSGKQSYETVFAITGLAPLPEEKANANVLLEIARGQWSVENGNLFGSLSLSKG